MAKKTKTLHADPNLIEKLKNIKAKVKLETGKELSLTEVIGEISRTQQFEQAIKQICEEDQKKLNFGFRMDK